MPPFVPVVYVYIYTVTDFRLWCSDAGPSGVCPHTNGSLSRISLLSLHLHHVLHPDSRHMHWRDGRTCLPSLLSLSTLLSTFTHFFILYSFLPPLLSTLLFTLYFTLFFLHPILCVMVCNVLPSQGIESLKKENRHRQKWWDIVHSVVQVNHNPKNMPILMKCLYFRG